MTVSRIAAPGALRCVIVGAGLDAAFAAATLARHVPAAALQLSVVAAAPAGARPGAVDASVPMSAFAEMALALDDDATLVEAGGSFSLGVAGVGWQPRPAAWFRFHSPPGAPLGPLPFAQVLVRLREAGRPARVADYSLAALAAQAGRFARPTAADGHSVLATLAHGLHFDLDALERVQRARAEAAGVHFAAGNFSKVERDQRGRLSAVLTHSGERVEAEFFIDCSGAAAVLADARAAADWIDWSAHMPCDRALGLGIADGAAPTPYSVATAVADGWLQSMPCANRLGLTLHYSSARLSDDLARARLASQAGDRRILTDYSVQALRRGRREAPWRGNCVALGATWAALDPLGGGELQVLAADLVRLLQLLPGPGDNPRMAAEYNRRSAAYADELRDLAAAHYLMNGRKGETFWNDCRRLAVPDTLRHRLELYRGLGRILVLDEEAVPEAAWLSLFDGQGLQPAHHNALAARATLEELESHTARIRSAMLGALAQMPAHAQYLASLRRPATVQTPADPYRISITRAWGRT
jgi:tryptophan halogenase